MTEMNSASGSSGSEGVSLMMVHRRIRAIPHYSFPDGFSCRMYQKGDELAWTGIHELADKHNNITPLLFRQQFGVDDKLLAERQLYLLNDVNDPIGTCTAWIDDINGDSNTARIHWLAIVPAYQGQGLSKPLLSLTCTRIAQLGHRIAYLTTDPVRIPAIRLYLKFGFSPWFRSDREKEVWGKLLTEMKDNR